MIDRVIRNVYHRREQRKGKEKLGEGQKGKTTIVTDS